MHLDNSTLILTGIAVQLLASAARHFWTKPQQQAQIDRIEGQVQSVLSHVRTLNEGAPNSTGGNHDSSHQ